MKFIIFLSILSCIFLVIYLQFDEIIEEIAGPIILFDESSSNETIYDKNLSNSRFYKCEFKNIVFDTVVFRKFEFSQCRFQNCQILGSDFESKISMEKHQAIIYQKVLKKLKEYQRLFLLLNNYQNWLTAEEKFSINYFHGNGI